MPDEIPIKSAQVSSQNAMSELMEQTPEIAPEPKQEPTPESQSDSVGQPKQESVPETKEDSSTGEPESTKPPEEEASKAPSTPEEDPDLKKLKEELAQHKLRSDAAPKTGEQFDQVKAKVEREFLARRIAEKEREELRAKVEAAEARAKEAADKFPEDKQSEYQKLKEWYENYGMIDNPEWTQPYDQKITAHSENIMGILKSTILPEGSAKYINDHGGPAQFRYSSAPMPSNFKNEDGTPMTHSQYWSKYIDGSESLPKDKKDDIEDLFREIRGVNREKQTKVQDIQQNRSTYAKQSQEQAKKAQEEWGQRASAHAAKYADKLGDVARVKEIPANATPDETAAIKRHNSRIEQAQKHASSIGQRILNEPEAYVEAVVDASRARVMDDIVKETEERAQKAEARAEKAEKELEKIKASSSTVSKGIKPSDKPRGPRPNASSEEVMAGMMKEVGQLK